MSNNVRSVIRFVNINVITLLRLTPDVLDHNIMGIAKAVLIFMVYKRGAGITFKTCKLVNNFTEFSISRITFSLIAN